MGTQESFVTNVENLNQRRTVGVVLVVLLTKANSVLSVVRENLQVFRNTNATNAAGNPLTRRTHQSFARNVATPLTTAI